MQKSVLQDDISACLGMISSQALWVPWQKGVSRAPAAISRIIFAGLFAGFTLPSDQVSDYIDQLMRIDRLGKVFLIAGVHRPEPHHPGAQTL